MSKLINLGLGLGLVLLAALTLAAAQNKTDDVFLSEYEKVMGDLFAGQDDLRQAISTYLEKVPISHKTQKNAQRCLISARIYIHTEKHLSTNTTNTTTTTITTTRNNTTGNTIKTVLGIIFKNAKLKKSDKICKECNDCVYTTSDDCVPCPKNNCLYDSDDKCPPCLLPESCFPRLKGEKCPPKPICEICSATISSGSGNSTSSISQNSTSSISESSGRTKKTSKISIIQNNNSSSSDTPALKLVSTSKPRGGNHSDGDGDDNKYPPGLMNLMRLLVLNEEAMARLNGETTSSTTTTTTTSSSSNFTSSSTSTMDHDHSSSSTTTTTKMPSQQTSKKSTAISSSSSTKKPSRSTTRRPTKTSSATVKAGASKITSRKPSGKKVGNHGSSGGGNGTTIIDGKMTMTGQQSMVSNSTSTTTNDGHTITNSTTTTRSSYGSMLFEKNIKIMVTNATIRDYIMKVIDGIPESTGGEEMKLAENVLTQFGEERLPLTKIKGSTRSYSYRQARGNVRDILGHILERYKRKKCECKPCRIINHCKCKKTSKKTCPTRKPNNNCPPCMMSNNKDIECPAPKGCPTYPACKPCKEEKKDNNPDDDGKLEDLDDVDKKEVLRSGELMRDQQCKNGLTCSFQKTCGHADKNPLTPKTDKSAYMNGGENEVYGEWPHFASLRIDMNGEKGMCGGVLISDRHVLTAAHCMHKPTITGNVGPKISTKSIKVILGEHDKTKKDEHEEEFNVTNVCLSKKFFHDQDHGTTYDYALLTLDKNVTFNDYIQPACLPHKHLDLNKKTKCYVIGMGATKMITEYKPQFSNIVQKMPVVRASCKSWGIKHDDRSRHCFTKANAKGDTCGGDSGGPILCLSKQKRWTLAGLVSYGSEKCDGSESVGWVAVYTRIQTLLKTMNSECKI